MKFHDLIIGVDFGLILLALSFGKVAPRACTIEFGLKRQTVFGKTED
jgi:hypothetical protein